MTDARLIDLVRESGCELEKPDIVHRLHNAAAFASCGTRELLQAAETEIESLRIVAEAAAEFLNEASMKGHKAHPRTVSRLTSALDAWEAE